VYGLADDHIIHGKFPFFIMDKSSHGFNMLAIA